MGRKGQVLVGFLLLLPLFLILFVFVVDVGFMKITERNVESTIKEAITYGLKQEQLPEDDKQQKIETILKKNIDSIQMLEVTVTSEEIKVHVVVTRQNLFGTLINQRIYKIDKTYKGYNDQKIRIIKE